METPALELWLTRFDTGWQRQNVSNPSTWVYDDLWRAACREKQAMEAKDPDHREKCLQIAQEILSQEKHERS